MIETNGLYLNEVWVMGGERISTSFQGNDLSKPATLQTSFSRTFKLPDNLTVRRLLESCEQLDSTSAIPYNTLPAFVIDNGELIFDGVARLSSYSNGWEVELKDGKSDLYSRLDRSIRTADLSRFDHPWSLDEINRLATTTDGVCYPLADYGLLSENMMPLDTIYPAVFIKTVLGQLLKEEDYVLVGDLPDNLMYRSMVLPFVESEPTNHDQDWQDARSARLTVLFNHLN